MPSVEYALYGESDYVKKCPICGTVFGSRRKDGVYCSNRCSNTKDQRNYVKRKRGIII